MRHITKGWYATVTALLGQRIPEETIPRQPRRRRTPVEAQLRRGLRAGWTYSVGAPFAALLIAWVSYLSPGAARQDPQLGGFWTWWSSARTSWDPAGTMALLASVVLPLFLAMHVGRAASRTHDDAATAS